MFTLHIGFLVVVDVVVDVVVVVVVVDAAAGAIGETLHCSLPHSAMANLWMWFQK